MKIIIDGRRLTPRATGVGRYLSLLLNEWAASFPDLPFQPFVVLHENRPIEMDPWKNKYQSRLAGENQPGWLWENISLASSEFRDLPLFAPANLVPLRWRGPVLLVVHDTFCEHPDSGISTLNRLRFRGRYRRAANRADLIICPSNATAADCNQFFQVPESRMRVIPPGLPAAFKPADGLKDNSPVSGFDLKKPFILFVGKKSPRRHFPQIVEAVQQLQSSGESINLVTVGPDSPDAYRKSTSHPWIHLGHVPDSILIKLYQNALALVWPSRREGFGLPVAEAMACGCPVITNCDHALAEVAGNACLPLQGFTSSDIENAISTLLRDTRLRESLITKGLQQASRFSVGEFAASVAEAIHQITL